MLWKNQFQSYGFTVKVRCDKIFFFSKELCVVFYSDCVDKVCISQKPELSTGASAIFEKNNRRRIMT